MKRTLFALAFVVACAGATPPANWSKGGAPLQIPRARWVYGELTVDVAFDGKILVNGEHVLSVDAAGRVFEPDASAVALLERSGRLVGAGDEDLGFVGSLHASHPGEETAWITVSPTGEVIRYGSEGERIPFGAWIGCNATAQTQQVCTLITHLVGPRLRAYHEERGGIGVGVGLGIGVPVR